MSDSTNPPSTELLAPAGDWEALRAAVANGADAVYFGLEQFNARHRAHNFSLDELPRVIEYLHARNVRGYVTFNTLIFSDELPAAVEHLEAIHAAGADAAIVQDLGLARLLAEAAPGLAVHGSTQMTLTEPLGIEFVRRLGIERVIAARELSLEDLGEIRRGTDVPLEVFVHGALCVAYSGQCLTSEALGGRSANRGQCAQACRLPYELIVDGQRRDLGDRAYLLSPQDLAAIDLVDQLAALGIVSLKIEGRLKSAHYVAATTGAYRQALDAARVGQPFTASPAQRLDLEQSFSRGLSPGFLQGVDHQQLVPARFPKSRGVRVGRVATVQGDAVLVELEADRDASVLKPGDGVVFDEGHPEQDEQGGRVVAVRDARSARGGQQVAVTLLRGSVNLAAIAPGSLVWKTDDPALRRRLERTYSQDVTSHRAALHFTLTGKIGGRLALRAVDEAGRAGDAEWPGPLQVAQKHPITIDAAREQLDRLGDTPFALGEVTLALDGDALVPKSVLNDLRRRAVAALLAAREHDRAPRAFDRGALERLRAAARGAGLARPLPTLRSNSGQEPAELAVLVRTAEQLAAVLAWHSPSHGARRGMIYCDYEDVRRYREAVAAARAARAPIGLATLRIMKPHEQGLLAQIARHQPDAVLVRNLGSTEWFRRNAETAPLLIGDYSLNVSNELSAQVLRDQGVAVLTPSFDLNWEQLSAMLRSSRPEGFEVVVHQHMPMFHMEHCVFAATMSSGKDWRDCGRPCDRHQVELRDRTGADLPLLPDTGCRNTVFNAVAQSAAEYIPRLRQLGVRRFRVDLLRERAADVAPLLDRYARVIGGEENGREVWRQLSVLNQLGVTRGTLQVLNR